MKEYTYLGIIGEVRDGLCRIEQRNKFSVGEIIEIMKPNGENVEAKVERILNEEGEEQESAPHSNRCYMWRWIRRRTNMISYEEQKKDA